MSKVDFYVTPNFNVKTEWIPLCVSRSSFTHKPTNSEINSKTSVFITSNLITSPKGLSSRMGHRRATGRSLVVHTPRRSLHKNSLSSEQ
jgi:hypothetical protein